MQLNAKFIAPKRQSDIQQKHGGSSRVKGNLWTTIFSNQLKKSEQVWVSKQIRYEWVKV